MRRTLVFGIACSLALTFGVNAQVPEVGDTAPDFTLETIEGNEITLSNFRGKVVFVNFFGYS